MEPASKRIILIVTVIAAAVMELIDTSIVNVALNNMSGNLGATLEDISWVVTAYGIANVIIIPMTSFLVNNLGRRVYYISSILLFTFCSVMCGQSTGIWELVIFRFFQGIGGGALLSVSAVVVYEQFPKEKQNIASALFGIGVFLGPTIGPTLGGYITDNLSWPWIFYINLPIGILTAISCLKFLPESPHREKDKKIDIIGILLLIIGIGSLQTVLERGETEDWFSARYIIVLSIAAMMSIILFVKWELSTKNPVVNLRILKHTSLSISALLTFITGIGLYTSIFLTPILAQRFLGYSPTDSGLLLLTGAIVAILALILTGRLLQKGVHPALIVLAGFISFIYFNWTMAHVNLEVSFFQISCNLIFRGIGMALLTVPLATLAVSALPANQIAEGAAINNMMRQLGGSFGIALINTYVARRMATHHFDLVSHLTADNTLTHSRTEAYIDYFLQHGSSKWEAGKRATLLLAQKVNTQSSFLSYLDGFTLIGLFFAMVIPLLLIFARGNNKVTMPIAQMEH